METSHIFKLFAGVAFIAFVGLVAAMFEVRQWTGADLADWVQAIGSILAVGSAAWVGVVHVEEQRRRDARVRKERDAENLRERYRALEAVARQCSILASRLDKMLEELRPAPPNAVAVMSLYRRELKDTRRVLRDSLVGELLNSPHAMLVHTVRGRLDTLRFVMKWAISLWPTQQPTAFRTVEHNLASSREAIRTAVRIMRQTMADRADPDTLPPREVVGSMLAEFRAFHADLPPLVDPKA